MHLAELPLSAEENWYTSGTTWTIIGIVVTLILGCWTVWAAFRTARPRRDLHITLDPAVALLREAPGLAGKTEVNHDGRVLVEPYVATVHIKSSSSVDIKPETFSGKPLELDFGVPVVALLEKHSVPGRAAVRDPEVKVFETALHIEPALLTRRHELRYTVLLDGQPEFRPVGDLADVTVHDDPWVAPPESKFALLKPFLVILSYQIMVLITTFLDVKLGEPLPEWLTTALLIAMALVVTSLPILLLVFAALNRQKITDSLPRLGLEEKRGVSSSR